MTYINSYCADAGTVNCPCPLAETGDCLICSRLAGKRECDCHWAGLCIYNEYIQNDNVVRNPRQDQPADILEKRRYGEDLLILTLKVPRALALQAAAPGSFVFLRTEEGAPFTNVPVSIMASDVEEGRLHLALRIISGKTKRIAAAEDRLMLRGIYRNGLLGGGLAGLTADVRLSSPCRWLILTRGAGFAPAVHLLRWANGRADAALHIDTENIGQDVVSDCLNRYCGLRNETACIRMAPLTETAAYREQDYDRIIILASDYYIGTITRQLSVPRDKLVVSNNFHMCCGEGVCGACSHTDARGNLSKMCKCRRMEGKELE